RGTHRVNHENPVAGRPAVHGPMPLPPAIADFPKWAAEGRRLVRVRLGVTQRVWWLGGAIWMIVANLAGVAATRQFTTPRRTLAGCADPNNLPYSNDRREGFENKLADLVARELHAHVEYTWWAQRRGYVRSTIAAGHCDVLMGVPSRVERTLVTRP